MRHLPREESKMGTNATTTTSVLTPATQFIQAIAYQGNENLAAELQDIAGTPADAAALADSILLDYMENTLSDGSNHNPQHHKAFLFLKVLRSHLVALL